MTGQIRTGPNVKHLASLPMYDLPEIRRETDALWELLATHMRRAGVTDVPATLNRDDPYDSLWSQPTLLISQACGLPLMNSYQDMLRPLATPVYDVEGCRGARYSSAVLIAESSNIAKVEELRGKACAVNSLQSQSGCNAIRAMVAPLNRGGRFFSEVRITGSHRLSMASVAAGETSVCAVDCVTYALLSRYAPESTNGTRILGFTPECPGLPVVVRADLDEDRFTRLRLALKNAIDDPAGAGVREALFIKGIEETELDDYRSLLRMAAQADALGYAELR